MLGKSFELIFIAGPELLKVAYDTASAWNKGGGGREGNEGGGKGKERERGGEHDPNWKLSSFESCCQWLSP